MWQDFKHGIGQLSDKPGFALTAVISLALGIGANAAFFAVFDQIRLRLPSVANPRLKSNQKREDAWAISEML